MRPIFANNVVVVPLHVIVLKINLNNQCKYIEVEIMVKKECSNEKKGFRRNIHGQIYRNIQGQM
jgi:hypothetical protein